MKTAELTSGFGVVSVWMNIVRLSPGDEPFTLMIPDGCWYGRSVGLRRLSEDVIAGRPRAL